MKRIALCIVSVISLSMTLPARAFEEPQDKVSPPTLQLDGLKARIQENDPNVQTTFADRKSAVNFPRVPMTRL